MPRDHIDAVLRELLGVELHLKYGDVVSDRVLSLIGVPQGDPGSPLYFASTIDMLLRPLLSRWLAAGVGLTLSSDDVEGHGLHMPLLAWMDDLNVFCTSAEDATRMVRDICNACEPAGLTLHYELSYTRNNGYFFRFPRRDNSMINLFKFRVALDG